MAYWDRIKTSGDIDDRRGLPGMAIGGLGGSSVLIVIVVAALNLLFGGQGVDFNNVLQQLQQTQVLSDTSGLQAEEFAGADNYEVFTAKVLGSANDTWRQVFTASGKLYREPKLVLFRNATQSACGLATSQVGPHYCPADETIYIDETFFSELTRRFGAKGGDVAEAYVIAHEVGHHVQNQLGLTEQVAQSNSNEDSIRLELQADCFAGVWGYSIAKLGVLENGEINEAIDAAEAVGDDRIQEKTAGRLTPENWTHGSSEQRKQWFNVGYTTGDPAQCTTF